MEFQNCEESDFGTEKRGIFGVEEGFSEMKRVEF